MKKLVFIPIFIFVFNEIIFAQNTWTKKADFTDNRFKAISFSINNIGYVGCGNTDTVRVKDFYAYNPNTNSWLKKADFIGEARMGAIAFSIGNKGYIGGGYNPYEKNKDTILVNAFEDFYEYNADSNTWIKKANLPTGKRVHAIAFSIGNKGYLGLGNDTTGYVNDFWEYDPLIDKWTKKANYPDSAASFAVGFSIDNYGYVGTGFSFKKISNNFWRYNPISNSWNSIANIDSGIYQASSFTINGKGYIVGGIDKNDHYYNTLREYDPVLNKWTNQAFFPNGGRVMGSAFSINGSGYFGLGLDSNYKRKNDIWEYKPSLVGVEELKQNFTLEIYPNPNSGMFVLKANFKIKGYQIYDVSGKIVVDNAFENEQLSLNLVKGIYLLKVENVNASIFKRFVVN